MHLRNIVLTFHSGSNPDLPVYLSIKGRVYDVSAGKSYKKGGGYNGRVLLYWVFILQVLLGKMRLVHFWICVLLLNASKKQIHGTIWTKRRYEMCYVFLIVQMKTIDDWVAFYDKDKKYSFVGYNKRD